MDSTAQSSFIHFVHEDSSASEWRLLIHLCTYFVLSYFLTLVLYLSSNTSQTSRCAAKKSSFSCFSLFLGWSRWNCIAEKISSILCWATTISPFLSAYQAAFSGWSWDGRGTITLGTSKYSNSAKVVADPRVRAISLISKTRASSWWSRKSNVVTFRCCSKIFLYDVFRTHNTTIIFRLFTNCHHLSNSHSNVSKTASEPWDQHMATSVFCCCCTVNRSISFSGSRRSGESICPIWVAFFSTQGNHSKLCAANLEAILLTNHACKSDSCTITGIRNDAAAKATGKATYHPLQKTTSILFCWSRYILCIYPALKYATSRRFSKVLFTVQYLLSFPDLIGTNLTEGWSQANLSSICPFVPNRKSPSTRSIISCCV